MIFEVQGAGYVIFFTSSLNQEAEKGQMIRMGFLKCLYV